MVAALIPLVVGIAAGFVVAWAQLSDPAAIRDMLMLRDPHVFLVMGSAVKRVPSMVEGLGAAVVIRMLLSVIRTGKEVRCCRRAYRAPIAPLSAPLSAVSRETVGATSWFGSATGVLFTTLWRFVSDAILM